MGDRTNCPVLVVLFSFLLFSFCVGVAVGVAVAFGIRAGFHFLFRVGCLQFKSQEDDVLTCETCKKQFSTRGGWK